jgi:hypothetical protein
MTDSDIRELMRLSDEVEEAFLCEEWINALVYFHERAAHILRKDPNGIRHVYAEEMRRTA